MYYLHLKFVLAPQLHPFFFNPHEFEFDFQSKKSELKSLLNQNGCKWTGQSD